MDADARRWVLGLDFALEVDGPAGERDHVGADHHDLVAERLDHPGVDGQGVLDGFDEAFDHVDRASSSPRSSVRRV